MTSFVIVDFYGVGTRDLQHSTWPTQSDSFWVDLDKTKVQLLLSLLVSICWPYVDKSGLAWLVYGSCLIFQQNAPFFRHYDTRRDFVRGAHLRSRSFHYHNHHLPDPINDLRQSTIYKATLEIVGSDRFGARGRFDGWPWIFVYDLAGKTGQTKDWFVLHQPGEKRLSLDTAKFLMDVKVPESARSAPPIFIRIFWQTNFVPLLSFSTNISNLVPRILFSRIWSSAQDYATLLSFLNPVDFFISDRSIWSGGNVLYHFFLSFLVGEDLLTGLTNAFLKWPFSNLWLLPSIVQRKRSQNAKTWVLLSSPTVSPTCTHLIYSIHSGVQHLVGASAQTPWSGHSVLWQKGDQMPRKIYSSARRCIEEHLSLVRIMKKMTRPQICCARIWCARLCCAQHGQAAANMVRGGQGHCTWGLRQAVSNRFGADTSSSYF